MCFSQKEWESNEVCQYKSELYFTVPQLLCVSGPDLPDLPFAYSFASLFFESNLMIMEQGNNGKQWFALTFRRFCELLTARRNIIPIKME